VQVEEPVVRYGEHEADDEQVVEPVDGEHEAEDGEHEANDVHVEPARAIEEVQADDEDAMVVVCELEANEVRVKAAETAVDESANGDLDAEVRVGAEKVGVLKLSGGMPWASKRTFWLVIACREDACRR